ncbi:MAG: murein biosynthesis integral membrane protein MurJ [Pseudomonadales bacterium]|nr:murein biosynthesis integral membrane protein MurJ [Pseudomonadales bacterium]
MTEASQDPKQPRNLARQGGVVASMTLVSRITGLVRDVFLSYLLGASQFADMFFVAFRIPNFFRRLFAEGAFSQAFVPVLMRYRDQGQAELMNFLAPLSGIFSLGLCIVVILGMVFADGLTFLFAPGFAETPGRLEATADLVFITFPYLGFISLTAYAGALLNAHDRFAVPAITPVLLNFALIGATLVAIAGWSDRSQIEILAWGVLVAGVVQLLFQVPSVARLGLLAKPTIDTKHEGVRRVGKLLIPAVLAGSVGQINALINTVLASMLMTGSVSWLYYADRLLELPVGLVAIALGTVLLPHLSRMAADKDEQAFRDTLSWGIGLGLMLGLPAAVALFVLADGLIATVFMSIAGGAMTVPDARMAGLALEMFALALPGFVLVRILAPAFYAHEDTQKPFKYASYSVVANLIVSLSTFQWFGHVGLAWATAIAAWVNVLGLYFGLTHSGRYRVDIKMLKPAGRAVLAASLLAVGLHFAVGDLPWLHMPELQRVVWMAGICVVGFGGYFLVLFILGFRFQDLNHYSSQSVE